MPSLAQFTFVVIGALTFAVMAMILILVIGFMIWVVKTIITKAVKDYRQSKRKKLPPSWEEMAQKQQELENIARLIHPHANKEDLEKVIDYIRKETKKRGN